MPRKVLISLLVTLLVVPLNTSAAAWMAMSMSNSEQHVQHMTNKESGISSYMTAAHSETFDGPQAVMTHEHDASDCEDHCASCSNHCSTLGIVTSTLGLFDPDRCIAGSLSGMTTNRFELLFRPPIFV